MITEQMEFWKGEFGQEYTDRNVYSFQELDQLCLSRYGVSRSEMTSSFLEGKEINNLLEVGCNIGNQLRHLQSHGFNQLYGIELQPYAVEKSKGLCQGINIIQGSAFDIPFKNEYFDLACTFGVLIHIAPIDIHMVMKEIHRVSKKYIWGIEYFSDEYEEINYRGHTETLWKTNFAKLYLEYFPDLKLVKEEKFQYKDNPTNCDQMFLLEKV